MVAAPRCHRNDWPTGAMDANPLRMLQVLVTRKDPYEKTRRALGRHNRLEVCLRAMTLEGAYAMRKADELGSIEKGKSPTWLSWIGTSSRSTGARSSTRGSFTRSSGKIAYHAKLPKGRQTGDS